MQSKLSAARSHQSRRAFFSDAASKQNDVEPLLRVAAFNFENHALTHRILQDIEGVRFVFQEKINHALACQNLEFLRVPILLVFPHDFPEDVVADRSRRLHKAPSRTHGAGFAQNVRE